LGEGWFSLTPFTAFIRLLKTQIKLNFRRIVEKEVEIGFLKNVGRGSRNKAGQTSSSSKVVASIFIAQRYALSTLTNGMLMIDDLNEESKLIEAGFEYVPCSEKDDATIYRQRKY
jgi:hypothetical protein